MTDIDRLPDALATYKDLVHVIPSSYLIANGVFHLLGESMTPTLHLYCSPIHGAIP